MGSIEVLTGQHVAIEYKPANLVQRIFATLIDVTFQFCYSMAFLFIFYDKLDNDIFNNWLSLTLFGLFLIPIIFYHFLFETFMGGQTPGKALLKIKVTNLDGSVTGIGGYFLRWVLRPVDIMIFSGLIGILSILLSKNSQRVGDMAAGTIVVKVSPKSPEINNEFYSFSENYQAKYPQAERLTEGQIKLITDVLEIPVRNEFDDVEHLDALAEKTKSALKINNNSDSREFLTQIVKDYNYYATLGF